jgi:hypothetical protein
MLKLGKFRCTVYAKCADVWTYVINVDNYDPYFVDREGRTFANRERAVADVERSFRSTCICG